MMTGNLSMVPNHCWKCNWLKSVITPHYKVEVKDDNQIIFYDWFVSLFAMLYVKLGYDEGCVIVSDFK